MGSRPTFLYKSRTVNHIFVFFLSDPYPHHQVQHHYLPSILFIPFSFFASRACFGITNCPL